MLAEFCINFVSSGRELVWKRGNFDRCLNFLNQDAKPPPLGRLNDREQAK